MKSNMEKTYDRKDVNVEWIHFDPGSIAAAYMMFVLLQQIPPGTFQQQSVLSERKNVRKHTKVENSYELAV